MGLEFPHLGSSLNRVRTSSGRGYARLDELYEERDAVSWYWRIVALAASWLILGGYLILPSTYYKPEVEDPHYRFNPAVLTTVIVALLTAGHSLTVLLWFAVRSWLFQAEAIFLPALASSALGLLSLLYAFTSTPAFKLTAGAIIHIVLSASGITIFTFLLVQTNRRIARIRQVARTTQNAHMPPLWQETEPTDTPGTTNFQKNYIANHFPQARPWVHAENNLARSGSYSSYNGSSYNPIVTEDDGVQQQMALLLSKKPDPSPEANNGSTFQLQWPVDEEDAPNTPANRTEGRAELQVGGVREFYAGGASASNRAGPSSQPVTRPRENSIWSKFSGKNITTTVTTRGRSDTKLSADSPPPRAKSREERRREIELGTLNSAV